MKKTFLILLLFIGIQLNNYAQKKSDVFYEPDLTWYGLDFTKAKFIGAFTQVGDAGIQNEEDMKYKYFPGWNTLVANERDKYDVRAAFKKVNVYYNLEVIDKVNNEADVDDLFTLNEKETIHMSEEKVKEMVSKYDIKDEKGVGIVFIVESFNRFSEEGSFYVTFFDIATKEVLLTKRVVGAAGGIGLKNYWARTVYNALNKSKSLYPKWKKAALK